MTQEEIIKNRDTFYEQKMAEYTLRIANAYKFGEISKAHRLELEKERLMNTRYGENG